MRFRFFRAFKPKAAVTPQDPASLLAADEARVAEEARQPLPEGSNWHSNGGAELEPLLAHTDVIDAAWLLQLARGEAMPERKGVVPPWQLVPAEAKLSLSTLRRTNMGLKLPVAVLSYGWADKGHPDPTGALLRRLIPVLEVMAGSCTRGRAKGSPDQKPAAWGIVWDFMSLPQRGYTAGYDAGADDRTPYQLARFLAGLTGINVWYGAKYTTTLVCDWPMPEGAVNAAPIEARGWCIFERRLSSVRKHADCCLALSRMPEGKAPGDGYYQSLEMCCRAGRLAPLAPDEYEATLQDGMSSGAVRFTNGKDATTVCIPQYRAGFLRLMGEGGGLSFAGCAWGDAEVRQLVAALAFAHAEGATTQAFALYLDRNRLTAAAIPPLAEAFERGMLPGLRTLDLRNNEALGDEGAVSLAAVLSKGKLPKLEDLLIGTIGMGDTGAAALARALGGAPALKLLLVGGNQFGEAAAAELKAACAACGAKAMKDRDAEL